MLSVRLRAKLGHWGIDAVFVDISRNLEEVSLLSGSIEKDAGRLPRERSAVTCPKARNGLCSGSAVHRFGPDVESVQCDSSRHDVHRHVPSVVQSHSSKFRIVVEARPHQPKNRFGIGSYRRVGTMPDFFGLVCPEERPGLGQKSAVCDRILRIVRQVARAS